MSPAFPTDRLSQNPSTYPRSISPPLRYELRSLEDFESSDELILAISPDASLVWRDAALLPLDAIGPALMETWWSSEPIEQIASGPVTAWRAGEHVLGIARATRAGDLRSTTFDLYNRILNLVGHEQCHLARMWNYFTDINKVEAIERYQQFCIGRFEAFERSGLDMAHDLPAGSAVGSLRGNQVVIFLASGSRPQFIENPRQLSAFLYPERYGPRSPSFARAALLSDRRILLVSGTASIVGHETLHRGNLSEQVEETLRNLDVIVEEAFGGNSRFGSSELDHFLKVYVRNVNDQSAIERRLETIVPLERISFLHADICRSDLLVEIEAVIIRDSPP